jgi:hypothetical protein
MREGATSLCPGLPKPPVSGSPPIAMVGDVVQEQELLMEICSLWENNRYGAQFCHTPKKNTLTHLQLSSHS